MDFVYIARTIWLLCRLCRAEDRRTRANVDGLQAFDLFQHLRIAGVQTGNRRRGSRSLRLIRWNCENRRRGTA